MMDSRRFAGWCISNFSRRIQTSAVRAHFFVRGSNLESKSWTSQESSAMNRVNRARAHKIGRRILREAHHMSSLTAEDDAKRTAFRFDFFGCLLNQNFWCLLMLPKWCINWPNENHLIDLHPLTDLHTKALRFQTLSTKRRIQAVRTVCHWWWKMFTENFFIGMKSAL